MTYITKLSQHRDILENHSLLVTNVIQTIEDLRIFMEHHVYAVWDFMSLAKSLQHSICPSGNVWLPSQIQRSSSRLINEIILSEESDADPFHQSHISHFDLYCQSMIEIGADASHVIYFLDVVKNKGVRYALQHCNIPEPSRKFMTKTFDIIDRNRPHEIASAFTYGRETVIPAMFKRILYQLNLNLLDVPRFFYYLNRHIEVDGDSHGPGSINLLNNLCKYDPIKILEAEKSAIEAIDARIKFWDDLETEIVY